MIGLGSDKKAMNKLYEITSLKTHKMTMLLFKERKIAIPGDKGDPGGEWINQTKWRAGAK